MRNIEATPIESVRVLSLSKLPDGVLCAEVPCADYSALQKLPHSLEVSCHWMRARVIVTRTGWDSDRRIAYYKDNILHALSADGA